MSQPKYPIGIQHFSSIREGCYTYVDKTGYLQRLLDYGAKYVFLSRPRRFGKSLFLSTVEAFFLGRRGLFDGLEISRHHHGWERHPVLHLDLTGISYDSPDSVIIRLNASLADWEEQYGITPGSPANVGLRFERLIKEIHRQQGKRAVILVDEYDKPLLESFDDPDLQEKYRSDLRSFYSNLKSQDEHIKFAMLTGVTKFGHLSVFSDLNNLQDISLDERFSGICGITSDELHEYFLPGVQALAQRHGISAQEAFDILRINYDGYHFSAENAPDIYNPFSILNALSTGRISNYWFQTGTPTFLVKLIKGKGIRIQKLDNIEVDEDAIASVSFDYRSSLYPLLYQSGYLTIKEYNPMLNRLRLGFPNREVEQGFMNQLVKIYAPATQDDSGFSIADFYDDVMHGNAESFMVRLRGLFSDFNHDGFNRIDVEQHYQDVIYIIMKLMGFYTHIEYKTASGRIDLLVKTPEYIFVFEFKMDKTAWEALAQIDTKDYLLPFIPDKRKLIKIGANFSSKTHTLDSWEIQ